jgi:hypothetical protein
MSQFDVAIGMNEATLDQGVSGLYANSEARQKLFKGSQTGTLGNSQYTASWDIQAAPTFSFEPPSESQWSCSIDDQGQNPTTPIPIENMFQMVFPQFYGKYTLGTSEPVSGTTEVIAFVQMTIQGNKITLAPLSVWLDESKMSGWDQYILNQVILKNVLQQATRMLSGMNIPPLSFSLSGAKIELSAPVGTVGNGWLILAASLPSKGAPDITGVTWPNQPLFVLMSSDVVNQVVNALASQLNGKKFSNDGSKNGGKWSYTATIDRLDNVQPDSSDLTKINANVLFSFDASVAYGICSLSTAAGSM